MDARADRRIALLSIKPEYAQAIVEGRKQVEFRRASFAQDVDTVVIYATKPVGQVIGYFEVDGIDEASPTRLWDTYRHVGSISRILFRVYFRGARKGIAIKVGEVTPLEDPRPLEDLQPGLKPPQSFRYLGAGSLRKLGTPA